MKKRLLFISLALALALTMLMPGAVLAAPGKLASPSATSFIGGGQIFVTYMPPVEIKPGVLRFKGEIVQGFLASPDWDLLTDVAIFYSEHNSTVRVAGDGTTKGVMTGTFSITRADGSQLAGSFLGKITGNLFTGNITDEGYWMATKNTGVFKDIKAWGTWRAVLALGTVLVPGVGEITTLNGPLTWNGKYSIPKGKAKFEADEFQQAFDRASNSYGDIGRQLDPSW